MGRTRDDPLDLEDGDGRPADGFMLRAAAGRLCDGVAVRLAAAGLTPNVVSWLGLAPAVGAAACFAAGAGHRAPWGAGGAGTASWWPVAGAALLLLAGALDALDGALARACGLRSRYGAFLDSTLDRVAEVLVFLGCAVHFAAGGNVTFVALTAVAAGGSLLVSYVKSRAESLGGNCRVGYWQRGERLVLLTVAAAAGHLPAGLWVLAPGSWLTVARRIRHGHRTLAGRPAAVRGSAARLAIWRHPRGSVGYDLAAAAIIVFLLLAPRIHPAFTAASDPLGALLRRLG